MKKARVIKGIKIMVCVLLAIVISVAGILFFPLTGKKHVEVWSAGQPFDIAEIQTVDKERADFKILMFTDTQLWADLGKNKECYEQMDALVEKTQPDLITLPGDVLSAFASRFSINHFIKHMDSYQIPWAPVYGNHDNEIPTNSLNWQADKYIESEYCLMEKGPSNLYGCGNYVINITENNNPVYTLFMLDNGRYIEYLDEETNKAYTKEIYMGYEQIAWYEWNVKGIEKAAGRIVPSMTFSHFAQPEFREAVEKCAFRMKTEDIPYRRNMALDTVSIFPVPHLLNQVFLINARSLVQQNICSAAMTMKITQVLHMMESQ